MCVCVCVCACVHVCVCACVCVWYMRKCLCVHVDMHGRQCVCALWATLIAVNGHGAVPLVVSGLAGVGTVDRYLVVVGS